MAPQNVCRYWKFGHCKFVERCRLMHVNEVCRNPECEIKTCNMRHPRISTYFRDYRRCKFGEYYSFKNEENNLANMSDLDKYLERQDNKIEELEKKINDMGEKIVTLESEKAEHALENENQFEARITQIERRVYVMFLNQELMLKEVLVLVLVLLNFCNTCYMD